MSKERHGLHGQRLGIVRFSEMLGEALKYKNASQVADLITRLPQDDPHLSQTKQQLLRTVPIAYYVDHYNDHPGANALLRGMLLGIEIGRLIVPSVIRNDYLHSIQTRTTNQSGLLVPGEALANLEQYTTAITVPSWFSDKRPQYADAHRIEVFMGGLGAVAVMSADYFDYYKEKGLLGVWADSPHVSIPGRSLVLWWQDFKARSAIVNAANDIQNLPELYVADLPTDMRAPR